MGAVVIKGELIEASPAIGNAGGYVSNSYPYTDRCESCVVAFHTYYLPGMGSPMVNQASLRYIHQIHQCLGSEWAGMNEEDQWGWVGMRGDDCGDWGLWGTGGVLLW